MRAAAAAERIRLQHPTLDPYDKDARNAAIANELNANRAAGIPAKTSYQMALQRIDRPEPQRKVINEQYGAEVRKDPTGNAKALQSAMDAEVPGFFAKAPAAPVALQAEYSRLVGVYYGMNQNIDQARKLAVQQVQTTWGVSRMNGEPELVKYPPERLNIPVDALRADVGRVAKANGFEGDPATVHLTPDAARTDSSGGRVWSMTHIDPKTGAHDVILGPNNRPVVYAVPSPPDFAKAHAAAVAQQLDAARQERDANRAESAEQIQGEKELAHFWLTTPAGRAAMAH